MIKGSYLVVGDLDLSVQLVHWRETDKSLNLIGYPDQASLAVRCVDAAVDGGRFSILVADDCQNLVALDYGAPGKVRCATVSFHGTVCFLDYGAPGKVRCTTVPFHGTVCFLDYGAPGKVRFNTVPFHGTACFLDYGAPGKVRCTTVPFHGTACF